LVSNSGSFISRSDESFDELHGDKSAFFDLFKYNRLYTNIYMRKTSENVFFDLLD